MMNTKLATSQIRLNEWAAIIKIADPVARKSILIANTTSYPEMPTIIGCVK